MKKSILFVRPDFHCSFFYRDEFRKLGWKADIFVPQTYPEKLLYAKEDIIRDFCIPGKSRITGYINALLVMVWYLTIFWRYRYHIYYGRPAYISFFEKKLGLNKLFGESFNLSLVFAKMFGVKLVYLPTGCHDQQLRADFLLYDNGNVCNNCGFFENCNDAANRNNLNVIKKYFDFGVGWDPIDSPYYKTVHFKYKSINLSKWKPNLEIPEQHKIPVDEKVRIMHSFFPAGRLGNGKNIKGSPFIFEAVERLKNEGYPVEYFYVHDKPTTEMRYYQAQADILVEQLIYGWWGSTGVEAMTLGKPVVCYLRPSWKTFFFNKFPQYKTLPVVEADTQTIYEVLKKLVTDKQYRLQKGADARTFAEQHFNPVVNAKHFEAILLSL